MSITNNKIMTKMTTQPQLKQIQNIPDYYYSADGNVWSKKISTRYNPTGKLRLLKPKKHSSGYLYYGLFVGKGVDKKRLWVRGHRIIYEAFNGEIPYYDSDGKQLDIDHINTNRDDNSLSNLRLITHEENCNNKKKKL